MNGDMTGSRPRRTLASYVSPRAFAPGARAALEALGYRVVLATTQGRFDAADWDADLRLVDARHLDRLPRDETPVILLGSERTIPCEERRVVGIAPRPAEVSRLYPLLQRALEPHPRAAARAVARLPARCAHADRRWTADLVTLSESGCLLETASEMTPGLELNLSFPLPLGRVVSTRARVRLRDRDRAGLAFLAPAYRARTAIADYVQRRLATQSIR